MLNKSEALLLCLLVAISSIAILEAALIYIYQSDNQVLQANQKTLIANENKLIIYANDISDNANMLNRNLTLLKKQMYEVQSQANYWKGRTEGLENFLRTDIQSYCSEQLPSFVQIAKNVSQSHIYDIEDYNCVDFTKEFNKRMEKQGMIAKEYDVIMDCPAEWSDSMKQEYCLYADGEWKIGHAISMLRVYVDATAGVYIEPSMFAEWGLK
jgi:hypothetical protein